MRLPRQILTVFLFALLLFSCARVRHVFERNEHVYQAPRMGAEYRFDEGLRREKHPQNLFSKKELKDMEKTGTMSQQERTAPNTRIRPMQANSILTDKTRDTTRTGSRNTKPTDIIQRQRPDTSASHPADTTHP